MAAIDTSASPGLRVLAVEDEIDTLSGPLDSLSLDGHDVEWSPTVDQAIDSLRAKRFNLLILDQHVKGPDGKIDYEAGSKLATMLTAGELGDINVGVAFVFVTGSDDWVEESEMLKLPGYRGIVVKASDVTTKLRSYCAQVLRQTDPSAYLDRVLVRVERVTENGIFVVIPSWRHDEEVRISPEAMPEHVRDALGEGARLFARMDLSAASPEMIDLERWEIARPAEENDGLA